MHVHILFFDQLSAELFAQALGPSSLLVLPLFALRTSWRLLRILPGLAHQLRGALCYWRSESELVLSLSRASALAAGDRIDLLPGAIRLRRMPPAAVAASASIWAPRSLPAAIACMRNIIYFHLGRNDITEMPQ